VSGARPSRRELLAGTAAAAGGLTLGGRAGAGAASPPVLVDVHCHTFSAADLPIVGFVAHQIPGLAELSRFLTRWPEVVVRALLGAATSLPDAVTPTGDAELAALRALAARPGPPVEGVPPLPPGAVDALLASAAQHLPFTLGLPQRQVLDRVVETLYLAAHPRAAIAATVARAYPAVALFTPALVDYDAWSDDRAPTPLWQQILIQQELARLAAAGRLGRPDARFHPFVAFDPRRQVEAAGHRAAAARAPAGLGPDSTALEMVAHAVESGAFLGVKLYPPVGFAPLDNAALQPELPIAGALDRALAALYAYAEAREVAILTHASPSNEYALGLRRLVEPARWRPVLDRFPGLRLDLGHFGGELRGWMDQATALVDRFPHVYADLSNSPLVYDDAFAARLRVILAEAFARQPALKRRLMYGSDWWLSALDPNAGAAVERFRAVLGPLLTPDETADLMGRNALRFLGLLDDQNRPRLGAAARRLRAFYGAGPRPPWLA
jgi:predicted TIM-barrel fold metal-dependent hydrolase